MTLRIGQLLLFILLLAAPAYADPVVVNFSSGSVTGTTPVRTYTESGFTFTGGRIESFGGDNYIETNSNHVTLPGAIRIQWMGGTFDFLGADHLFSYGRSVFIGSNGVQMDLFTGSQLTDFGSAFQSIVWLDWVHYGLGGDFGPNPAGLDNFRFNTGTTPTPEPTTLLLLGSGLLGVARTVRKRRRG